MFRLIPYTIRSSRLPQDFEGYRIAHLSDLHGAMYGNGNTLLIQEILKAKPNLIVMTGDMADSQKNSIPQFIDLCRKLGSDFPISYIPGNHEQSLKKQAYTEILEAITQYGVNILENRHDAVKWKKSVLNLYGLVTPMAYYKDPLKEYRRGIHFSAKDTEQALGKVDPSCYNILLAHNPLYYPSYHQWGADLTLSGHIHGGIIRIPGLGGLLSPDVSFFPKYDGGHFETDGRHLIVSRGLGNNFLFRINNPPELVIITLSRETASCKQG